MKRTWVPQENKRRFGVAINPRNIVGEHTGESDSSDTDSELSREAWAEYERQIAALAQRDETIAGNDASVGSDNGNNGNDNDDARVSEWTNDADGIETEGSEAADDSDANTHPEAGAAGDDGAWSADAVSAWNALFGAATGHPASSSWTDRRKAWLARFEAVIPRLIPAVACHETADLLAPGAKCALADCAVPPSYRCYSCASVPVASNHFCSRHASLHQWNNHCHRVQDASDRPPPAPTTSANNNISKKIRCCENAKGAGRKVKLHSLTASETVYLVNCDEHSNGEEFCVLLARDYGFFPSRVRNTDHAFSHQLMSLALKFRSSGVAFQTISEVFFGNDVKDSKARGLYQPFIDAVRQMAVVMHHIHHGNFSPDIISELGLGQTVCPACIGSADDDVEGPAAFTMDGFDSANKRSIEQGGGGSHGQFEFTRAYFKTPVVKDVVAKGRAAGKQRLVKLGCEAQHKAGSESGTKLKGKDVDLIVHVDCAPHALVHRIYDVKGGERLLYADDTIKWGATMFEKRGFILGYDVACKELSHLIHYDMLLPIINAVLLILFVPAMHVYAHGRDCQCLFSPRALMGLGLTMDGEGHERFNSWLSRMIGLTQRETAENRQMDIVLFTEFYNKSKIRSLVAWTEGKLLATFAGLDEVKVAVGCHWETDIKTATYEEVVGHVTVCRQQSLERESVDAVTTKDDMRLQLDELVRSIVSMDMHLRKRSNTELAKKLKVTMACTFANFYKKLDQYNDMLDMSEPKLTFAIVKAGLLFVFEGLDSSNVEKLVTLYFRYCEDLFHHRNYMNNILGYYEKRKRSHWGVIIRKTLSLADERIRSSLLKVVERRMEVEDGYQKQAREVLLMFDENGFGGGLYFEKHLGEIRRAFQSNSSALSRQNIRNGVLDE